MWSLWPHTFVPLIFLCIWSLYFTCVPILVNKIPAMWPAFTPMDYQEMIVSSSVPRHWIHPMNGCATPQDLFLQSSFIISKPKQRPQSTLVLQNRRDSVHINSLSLEQPIWFNNSMWIFVLRILMGTPESFKKLKSHKWFFQSDIFQ